MPAHRICENSARLHRSALASLEARRYRAASLSTRRCECRRHRAGSAIARRDSVEHRLEPARALVVLPLAGISNVAGNRGVHAVHAAALEYRSRRSQTALVREKPWKACKLRRIAARGPAF